MTTFTIFGTSSMATVRSSTARSSLAAFVEMGIPLAQTTAPMVATLELIGASRSSWVC